MQCCSVPAMMQSERSVLAYTRGSAPTPPHTPCHRVICVLRPASISRRRTQDAGSPDTAPVSRWPWLPHHLSYSVSNPRPSNTFFLVYQKPEAPAATPHYRILSHLLYGLNSNDLYLSFQRSRPHQHQQGLYPSQKLRPQQQHQSSYSIKTLWPKQQRCSSYFYPNV